MRFGRQRHTRRGRLECPAFAVGDEQDRPRGQLRAYEGFSNLDDLFDRQRAGKPPGKLVQGLRALLPLQGLPRPVTQCGGEMRGRQGRHQHGCEGDQVLDVADRQRESWRNEEDIEAEDAEDRSQDGRIASQLHGDQQDREQEQHHDVGQIEIAKERCRQERRPGTSDHRQRDALRGTEILLAGGGIERHLAFPTTGREEGNPSRYAAILATDA